MNSFDMPYDFQDNRRLDLFHSNLTAELHLAVSFNDLPKVLELVPRMDVNGISAVDNEHSNALHLAVRNGNEAITKVLLEHGVDTEVKDSEGYTPLMLACKFGNVSMVEVLLQQPRSMLLHFAVENEWVELLKQLLKSNINLEMQCANNQTPLSRAIRRHFHAPFNSETFHVSLAMIKLLLEAGANREVKFASDRHFSEGSIVTPLLGAMYYEREALFDLLIAHGANLEQPDSNIVSPLAYAAARNFRIYVNKLLAIDATLIDRCDEVVKEAVNRNQVKMTKLMLQKATPAARKKLLACKNEMGHNSLSMAVMKKRLRCAEHLLQYGAELIDLSESAKAQLTVQLQVPRWRNTLSCYSTMVNRHASTPMLLDLAAHAFYQYVTARKEEIQKQELPPELKLHCQQMPARMDLQQRYVKSEQEKQYLKNLNIELVSVDDKSLKEWQQSNQAASANHVVRKRKR